MTFVLVVAQGVAYIAIIAAMIVYLVKRRHPKPESETRVRAKVLRKDVGGGQVYSLSKQYMANQTDFSVTFDLGRSAVTLSVGQIYFDLLEPGQTGWLSYRQGRMTGFEPDERQGAE